MPGRVCLDVVAGPIQGRHFEFDGHDTFLFGRSPDCHAELAADDSTASRHHFLLEVNPPAARLRDLGSLNGTYVNGQKHGGREKHLTPEEAAKRPWPEVDLRDGDLIRVGATVISVRIDGLPPPEAPANTAGLDLLVELDDSSKTAPPNTIAGYALGPLLGRGGMGVVHLATRLADGATVALKLMRPEAAVDAHAREVFDREIAVTGSLRHPNVVTLFAHGSEGDTFYFAMEYCAGGSLSGALLQRALPLEPALATRVALQALDGLSFAHEQGFIHRDIKPENILLVDAEMKVVKLTDFGLAKSFQYAGLSGMTATGFAAGTLQFMPREQLTNFRLLRPASDVWSMGATLYYMLTLRYVRDFQAAQDPLAVVLGGHVVPVRTRQPDVPSALADVVDRAVEDDLERRYRSATEFRDALRKTL
jgi:eukaryotic-like serine/threonine-protein kinase